MVTFDRSTHTYMVDGRVVPSVNQILHAAGVVRYANTGRVAQKHMQAGTDAHTDIGLALMSLPYESSAHVDAALEIHEELLADGWRLEGVELILAAKHSPLYAGTLDALYRKGGALLVIDWKTGRRYKHYPLQVTAYAVLVEENYGLSAIGALAYTSNRRVDHGVVSETTREAWDVLRKKYGT